MVSTWSGCCGPYGLGLVKISKCGCLPSGSVMAYHRATRAPVGGFGMLTWDNPNFLMFEVDNGHVTRSDFYNLDAATFSVQI